MWWSRVRFHGHWYTHEGRKVRAARVIWSSLRVAFVMRWGGGGSNEVSRAICTRLYLKNHSNAAVGRAFRQQRDHALSHSDTISLWFSMKWARVTNYNFGDTWHLHQPRDIQTQDFWVPIFQAVPQALLETSNVRFWVWMVLFQKLSCTPSRFFKLHVVNINVM